MQNLLDNILNNYRQKGKRITKQRITIIELLLHNQEKTCKELYYMAQKEALSISPATIYRTVKSLEEMGIIQYKTVINFTIPLK